MPISPATAMISLCFGVTSSVAVWATMASPPLLSSFWSIAMTRTSCSTVSEALCWLVALAAARRQRMGDQDVDLVAREDKPRDAGSGGDRHRDGAHAGPQHRGEKTAAARRDDLGFGDRLARPERVARHPAGEILDRLGSGLDIAALDAAASGQGCQARSAGFRICPRVIAPRATRTDFCGVGGGAHRRRLGDGSRVARSQERTSIAVPPASTRATRKRISVRARIFEPVRRSRRAR